MPPLSELTPTPPFRIEALSASHDQTGFACGVEPLDRYFKEQVSQDIRRRATACFVAVDLANGRIAGYYTLAAGSVPLPDLPEHLAKRLPRYPSVPVARLGRLAIDQSYQGKRLGGALLWDAVARAARAELMAYALVVDAKDDNAEAFYIHHGFTLFGGRRLVLPLAKFTL
jgi:GNAT superfamily N-acetyltransferase